MMVVVSDIVPTDVMGEGRGAEFAGPENDGPNLRPNHLRYMLLCIFQPCHLLHHFPGPAFSIPTV